MPQGIDNLFRSRWFWLVLLLTTYVLPALLVRMPVALAMPWILIPNAHEGLLEVCGLRYLYATPRLALAFAVGFHLIFWSLCGLLLFRGRKLSPVSLRVSAVLLIVILALTIRGCCPAIDAVSE